MVRLYILLIYTIGVSHYYIELLHIFVYVSASVATASVLRIIDSINIDSKNSFWISLFIQSR